MPDCGDAWDDVACLTAGPVPFSDVSEPRDLLARVAFEEGRGKPYTDLEWTEAKRNLVQLMLIGIDWKRDRDERNARA